VAEGRQMSLPEVDSVARGRVWSGQKALDAGLVDTLGGIGDALAIAARMAGTGNYRVIEYPEQKGPLETVISGMGSSVRTWLVRNELGESYSYYEKLKQLTRLSGVQALLPFQIEIR
ncbi:MAG TPA: S49 family peptidase, partial [Anseongella sp.]